MISLPRKGTIMGNIIPRMRAVVSPQTVINNCMHAVEWTELGRGVSLVNSLVVESFTFVVFSEDYEEMSRSLATKLVHCTSMSLLSGGQETSGLQHDLEPEESLCWYLGNDIPRISVADHSDSRLMAGGGYASVYTSSLAPSQRWLDSRHVKYSMINLLGDETIWVPLITPRWGIGEGYYALAIRLKMSA